MILKNKIHRKQGRRIRRHGGSRLEHRQITGVEKAMTRKKKLNDQEEGRLLGKRRQWKEFIGYGLVSSRDSRMRAGIIYEWWGRLKFTNILHIVTWSLTCGFVNAETHASVTEITLYLQKKIKQSIHVETKTNKKMLYSYRGLCPLLSRIFFSCKAHYKVFFPFNYSHVR